MSFRNVIALIIAIVVGIFVVKILFNLLGFLMALIGGLIYLAIAAVVIYFLYRAFNNMLSSGRRLT